MLIVSTSPPRDLLASRPASWQSCSWTSVDTTLAVAVADSTLNRKYGGQIVGMLRSAGGRNKIFDIVKEWIADAEAVVNFL